MLSDYCRDLCLECTHKQSCRDSYCVDDCDKCKYKGKCSNTYDPEEDREKTLSWYDSFAD